MSSTVKDLLGALGPGGNVYTNGPPAFPTLVRLHKSSFVFQLRKMDPAFPIRFEVRNLENTGRYARPRRYVRVYFRGEQP